MNKKGYDLKVYTLLRHAVQVIGVLTFVYALTTGCQTRPPILEAQDQYDKVYNPSGVFTTASNTNYVFEAFHGYKWRKTRNAFYKLNKTCAMCNATKDIQVHHIKPWHLYPEERYSYENLVSLCLPCHFRFGHGRNWKAHNPIVVDMAEIVNNMLTNVVYRSE